jgi:PST family polysaccharide transporter
MSFAPFGIIPASAAFASRPLLLLPLPALLVRFKCAIPARVVFAPQRSALIAALIMGASVTALRFVLQTRLSNLLLLPLLIAVGAAVYAGSIALLLPELARGYAARFVRKPVA